ncbi:MAG: hypothetical protein Hyperionvirus2_171 [Hyperionvirus sp.]|uniref:Uncharacterized protein n=1 Tax=Hyperionvirus sp. TaxID=2487770 RepID=A0A3G5AAC0_9VIRU|nr:MAG: hypothetical protein Hyperionvirus2_171 [Hyperionvirus sp.]
MTALLLLALVVIVSGENFSYLELCQSPFHNCQVSFDFKGRENVLTQSYHFTKELNFVYVFNDYLSAIDEVREPKVFSFGHVVIFHGVGKDFCNEGECFVMGDVDASKVPYNVTLRGEVFAAGIVYISMEFVYPAFSGPLNFINVVMSLCMSHERNLCNDGGIKLNSEYTGISIESW